MAHTVLFVCHMLDALALSGASSTVAAPATAGDPANGRRPEARTAIPADAAIDRRRDVDDPLENTLIVRPLRAPPDSAALQTIDGTDGLLPKNGDRAHR